MRTSGAPADGPLIYIPLLVAVGLLLALFGGPSDMLRMVDRFLGKAAMGVVDTVKAAASTLSF